MIGKIQLLNKHCSFSFRKLLILCFILCNGLLWAQDNVQSGADLGKIKIPLPQSIVSKYTYDPTTERYIFSEEIEGYPVGTPLVLTLEEFEALVLKEQMESYFQEKIAALSGKSSNLEESQKNLLPEVYVNNKFFQTIFGSNSIDVVPQGSIGIDLGVRYQKTDNPISSPRDRRNFGFDFDQQISLSLLGNIGERLQIIANYDTESTFDFQNLIKIRFNPPTLADATEILPDNYGRQIGAFQNRFEQAQGTINEVREGVNEAKVAIEQTKQKIESLKNKVNNLPNSTAQVSNRVSNFLNGKVTEDGILQNIDIGNVSMPINSNLIQGAQSLFGVRTDLKFGRTTISSVFSEQRSQSQNITTQGGGTLQEFDLFALDYEEDRHYFLAQYFRDNYDAFLKTYPYINSPIQITRIEVWVTNRGARTQNVRNIVALQDLAEANPEKTRLDKISTPFFTESNRNAPPDNGVNRLDPETIGFGGLITESIRDIATVKNSFGSASAKVREGYDYAVLESARKLSPQEYSYHPQLGYISLNQRLSNDEILGVAFQYTYLGKVFQVGEFANGGVPGTEITSNQNNPQQAPVVQTNNLVVKMLKSSVTDVRQPVWDLMMKNIYNTGAFQLSEEDFKLSILYTDPSPINYMTAVNNKIWPKELEQQVLLNTFQLDRLNVYQDLTAKGDGFFDYVPGITIDPKFGRIIFPQVEPFGEFLFDLLDDPNTSKENYDQVNSFNSNQKKYVFREMYALTKAAALEAIEKNKFQLKGRYKSEGGDGIPIGAFNVPRGSVRVTAGGRLLQEGLDYTVNYEIGRVKILDEGLKASNIPIDISVENNSFFNQQNKRFSGINIIHQLNERVYFGATLVNLSENPLTQKANYGTEPVNNTMMGFNTNFSTEIPFLTRMANKITTVKSSTPSQLSFRGEVAALRARNPRNTQLQGETNVYIDDFEGAQTNIDIKGFNAWNLSSVPINGVLGAEEKGLARGYGRSKLAWYSIDRIFYSRTPPTGINNNDISDNTTRRIFIKEIFPEQDLVQGNTTVQNTLDLAYYPDEKGPYNNSPIESFEKKSKEHWAGITRSINATNFEQANVEFIEFWLLDTFSDLEADEDELGDLVFHLGNISEDILDDGRKQFENGLPGATENTATYETEWGKVPATQSLVYAFNTEAEDRERQDVGLDGLSDSEEFNIYNNGPTNDPAGDNYEYYIKASGNILERYKNYNGTDGNTPISFSDTDRGNTTEPDTEDINRDQSMNTIDSYFEYRIPIRKSMAVGNHPFVTDVRDNVKVLVPNGDEINTRWLQFKIPIQKGYYEETIYEPYFKSVNAIEDLRSIRFMRMLLHKFDQPVVFRFGTLDLVRGDWRQYTKQLNEEVLGNQNTTVDISTVNILENENRIPINYVLPPDIQREQINNNNTIVRQNEQSLAFRICDLQPMDARGIFKNVNLDMRQYKKIRMFIHAESIPGNPPLPDTEGDSEYDNRLVAFLRLGTDNKDNYYQIEIPLKPTPYTENTSNRLSADEVWIPDQNELVVATSLLSKLKSKALIGNAQGKALYFDEALNPISEFTPISSLPGEKKYKLSIRGNPTLGAIRTLMIGVKNPSEELGNTLCGEVWFNELRLSGIEDEGGWAAVGGLDANIADFANISATGRYATIGFGNVDQTPNQRAREDLLQYDLVTNLNLGQLVPENWGLEIPLNFAAGETIISPEYDPFYQDIKLKDRLASADRKSLKDTIKRQAQDYTRRKSISMIGVRKRRTGSGESKIYSPENFNFSYAYNALEHRDFELENLQEEELVLGANYTYAFKQKNISPFQKTKAFQQKKYWEWLKALNFSLLPNALNFNANLNRALYSQKFRQVYFEGVDASLQRELPNLQQHNFLFDYNYTWTHNLTRSLRLTFDANTSNIVRDREALDQQDETESRVYNLWSGLTNFGELNRHFHTLSLNYRLPFQYIPFLRFIDATYNYKADYSWQRGSEALEQVEGPNGEILGRVNTLQNGNTKTITGNLSFQKLYTVFGIKSPNQRTPARGNLSRTLDSVSKKRSNTLRKAVTPLLSVLNKIKRVQFNYSENNGTLLPGYLPAVGFAGGLQPTLGFTLGSQADLRYTLAQRGWLTSFPNFNETLQQIHSSKFNLSGQLVPLEGLLIDFYVERNFSENSNENFLVRNNEYLPLNTNVFGNLGVSTVMIKTSFSQSSGQFNPTFETFRENRLIVADRLASQNQPITERDETGFPKGYGKSQQDVVLHSFLAAYLGADPNKVALEPIKRIGLPNWNLKYSGLNKIPSLSKIFSRFSLNHGYRASYTINNFQTNFDYDADFPLNTDVAGNIIPERLFSNVTLVEQFNPLMQLDMELKNNFKFLIEINRDRSLSLSLDNNLLTEVSGNEYVGGLGYRFRDLRMRTNFNGRRIILKGDLNIKADLSYRNNITVLRNLEYDNNQVTAGQKIFILKITADYALSRNVMATFFYDHNFSKFAISTAFPQTSIRSGFTLRYNFGN